MNLAKLPQLAADKANHHLYGEAAAVAGVVLLPPLARIVGFELDRRLAAAAGAAVVGALKEVWDRLSGKGSPGVADFVATVSGALPVMLGLQLAAEA